MCEEYECRCSYALSLFLKSENGAAVPLYTVYNATASHDFIPNCFLYRVQCVKLHIVTWEENDIFIRSARGVEEVYEEEGGGRGI